MPTKKKIIYSILIVFAVIVTSGSAYAYHLYSTAEKMVDDNHESTGRENETSKLRTEQVNPIEDNVSILFIGIDERDPFEQSRSDALILATFNKAEKSIKLLSIPRDSYMYIPEIEKFTKVNHAHAYGGPLASIETLEEFFQIPIDYYVRLNFEAFVDVVDALGGIHYDVPFQISEMDSNDKADTIKLEEGYQQINGEEALALARTRKYDSDIQRGIRQQEIITAIVSKATQLSSVLKLEDVLIAIGDNMRTNFTFQEITSFSSYMINSSINIEKINLEGTGGYLDNGGWYYQVEEQSQQEITDQLREHLGLPAIYNTNDLTDSSPIHP
ncbi:LCP family protein [Oceanobacillus kimchii]|uniref:LCP family protein n=1 Tax=Oceanobacillus kimchii TaxID=746691 RepID=UPI003C719C76